MRKVEIWSNLNHLEDSPSTSFVLAVAVFDHRFGVVFLCVCLYFGVNGWEDLWIRMSFVETEFRSGRCFSLRLPWDNRAGWLGVKH